jgi:4-hydroxy-3-methylbut-2-enyl diphosphate reductase IspH
MPTVEELKEEERKLRQLRLVVSLTMSTISQTTLSLDEASKMVVATRELALRLFPGKELAFDLIYQPRFRRLLAERYRLH